MHCHRAQLDAPSARAAAALSFDSMHSTNTPLSTTNTDITCGYVAIRAVHLQFVHICLTKACYFLVGFSLGSKFAPPLPPPSHNPVRAFLKHCSYARNCKLSSCSPASKRVPPLYGPKRLECCTRQPFVCCQLPKSSCQETRNSIDPHAAMIASY